MAENNQESQGTDGRSQQAASNEGDKQSMLLKLAERTVVQAEALAQEITDHARQESETAGAKIIADASEKAKAEAQQTIDSAKRRAETLVSEAMSEAQTESEKALHSARSDSEKLLSKAQSDSEKLVDRAKEESTKVLSKARSDSEASLGSAQTEVQEILGKARQEAQSIISASQTRAASTESATRLQAEFFIRQTTQSVSDGIRASVLEICNNLLPKVEEFGKNTPEALQADEPVTSHEVETPMLDGSPSDDHDPATNGVENAEIAAKAKASKKSLAA
jgi:vacuolar-type H+-ATPase subunit H